MPHNFKVVSSLHFSPCPRNIRTLQKMRFANIPFRETIVARKLERIWKMYFIEVLLHYHFENGTLHKPKFLYFPRTNKWTVFLDRPSLCAS